MMCKHTQYCQLTNWSNNVHICIVYVILYSVCYSEGGTLLIVDPLGRATGTVGSDQYIHTLCPSMSIRPLFKLKQYKHNM